MSDRQSAPGSSGSRPSSQTNIAQATSGATQRPRSKRVSQATQQATESLGKRDSGSSNSGQHARTGTNRKPSAVQKTGRFQTRPAIAENEYYRLIPAHDTAQNRPVLFRRFQPNLFSDAADWNRFRGQLESLSALHVEGMLRVESIGGSPGKLYTIIPGTDGTTYRQKLASQPQPDSREVLADLFSVATSLDRLHQLGYAHGDLRPDTIFYDEQHHPLLGEVSGHYALSSWTKQSRVLPAELIGRLYPARYLAPEIASGGTVSSRADQYALACIALESLFGPQALAGDVQQWLQQPSSLNPQQQGQFTALKSIFERATHSNPESRFPTCEEFIRRLRSAVESSTTGWQDTWKNWGVPAAILLGFWLIWLAFSSYVVSSSRERKVTDLQAAIAADYPRELPNVTSPQIDAEIMALDPARLDVVQALIDRAQQKTELETAQQRKQRREEFLSAGSMTLRLSSTASLQPNDTFFYTGAGQIVPIDESTNAVTTQISVTTSKDYNRPVTLKISIVNEIDRVVGKTHTYLLPAGSRSYSFEQTISPPDPTKGWPENTKWSARAQVEFPGDLQPTDWVSTSSNEAFRIGRVLTREQTVDVAPASLLQQNYAQITPMQLSSGDTLQFEVSGKVILGSEEVYRMLTGKNAFGITALGTSVQKDPAKRYRILSDGVSTRWGALLYRIGPNGKWARPTLKATTGKSGEYSGTIQARSSGTLYFSIDSVTREIPRVGPKAPVPVGNPKRFWNDGGKFVIKFTKREYQPSTLPDAVKTRLEKSLE